MISNTYMEIDTEDTLIRQAKSFAEQYLIKGAEEWDKGLKSPEIALRKAISLFTPTAIAKSQGGFGSNYVTLCSIYEVLSAYDLAFTCALAVHTNVTVAMSVSDNVQLKHNYLPKLLSGEAIGAFLLTEPDVGSDASAITTMAKPVENGYSITGNKAWVTNGAFCDFMLVFCQTEAGSAAKGITALALERHQSGVKVQAPLQLIGSHAMGTTDVELENVQVDETSVAFRPGEAFKAAMLGINVARLGVAAMCNGAMIGALDSAIKYAQQREVFGKPVIKHQGMQWILADVATEIESCRSLTFQAARLFDSHIDATVMVAHAKKKATKTSVEAISQCMKALGANGLKRSYHLSRQLTASRVTECMDGTGEVMNIVIARSF